MPETKTEGGTMTTVQAEVTRAFPRERRGAKGRRRAKTQGPRPTTVRGGVGQGEVVQGGGPIGGTQWGISKSREQRRRLQGGRVIVRDVEF